MNEKQLVRLFRMTSSMMDELDTDMQGNIDILEAVKDIRDIILAHLKDFIWGEYIATELGINDT